MVGVFRGEKPPEKKPKPEQAPKKRKMRFTGAYNPYEDEFDVEELSFFEKQYLLETMNRSLDWKTSEQYTQELIITAEVFKALVGGEFGKGLQVVPVSSITRKEVWCNERGETWLFDGVLPRDMLFTITGMASWSKVPGTLGLKVRIGQYHLPFVPLTKLNQFKEEVIPGPPTRIVREYPVIQDISFITILPGSYYRISLLTKSGCRADMALLGWVFAFGKDIPERVEKCISLEGQCYATEKAKGAD